MKLEGANSGGLGDGSRQLRKADDFSQLKGYLDVTSDILGGHGPLGPPLKSASVTLVFTGRMLFLTPNENCPSTEGISPSQC